MITQDRFDRAVLSLYKAALGDVTWTSAAVRIHDMLGANGQSLTFADVSRPIDPQVHLSRFFVGTRRRLDLEQRYFEEYYARDEAIPRLSGLRDGEIVHKEHLYTDEEKRTSAAYNEFRRMHATEKGLFVGLDGFDGQGIVWSLGNSTERGGWTCDQIQAIERLGPHIRQFARMRHAMANARALGATLTALLENGRAGFIQLDRRGRVLEANDRARDILLRRDGVHDRGGVLAAGIPDEDAALQRMLAQALPPHGLHGTGGSLKLTRRKAGTPLVLDIHPVREDAARRGAREVGALVLVVDPAARPRVDPGSLTAVLGLTPAESRVAAALAAGQTVAETAGELGCAQGTLRTHLKRIYRKLGIRKQTELVRTVLSLDALRRPPP